jgi:hypothetical protein
VHGWRPRGAGLRARGPGAQRTTPRRTSAPRRDSTRRRLTPRSP